MTPKKSWEVSVNLVQESLKKNWKLSVDQQMNAAFQVGAFLAKKEIELGGKKNPAYLNLEKQVVELLKKWDGSVLALDSEFSTEKQAVLKQTPPIKEAVFTPNGNEGFPGKERTGPLAEWETRIIKVNKEYPPTKKWALAFLKDQTPEVQKAILSNILWKGNREYPEMLLDIGRETVEAYMFLKTQSPEVQKLIKSNSFWKSDMHFPSLALQKAQEISKAYNLSLNNETLKNHVFSGKYTIVVEPSNYIQHLFFHFVDTDWVFIDNTMPSLQSTKVTSKDLDNLIKAIVRPKRNLQTLKTFTITIPEFSKMVSMSPEFVIWVFQKKIPIS